MTGRDDEGRRTPRDRASRDRRRAALVLAGSGLFWIAALWIGPKLGLDARGRIVLDLIALAGFALGLWLTFRSGRPSS